MLSAVEHYRRVDLLAAALLDELGIHLPRLFEGTDEATDYRESIALQRMTRFPLVEGLWRATLAYYDEDVDLDELVRVIEGLYSVNGVPEVVIHGQLAGRLKDGYYWSPADESLLDRLKNEVVVSIKCPVNIGDTDEIEIFHVLFRTPQTACHFLEQWAGRGPSVFSMAASCYTHDDFAARWVEQLKPIIPLMLHLDVPTSALRGGEKAMIPNETPIFLLQRNLAGTPCKAMFWNVEGQPHVGYFIGDAISLQLLYGQLSEIAGDNLVASGNDWSQWHCEFDAVVRNILRCESFLDLRALESYRR